MVQAPVNKVDVPDFRQRAREMVERFNQQYVYNLPMLPSRLCGCEFWTADVVFYDAVKANR